MLKFNICIIKLRQLDYFWTHARDGKLADKLELTLCLEVLITQKLKLSDQVRFQNVQSILICFSREFADLKLTDSIMMGFICQVNYKDVYN